MNLTASAEGGENNTDAFEASEQLKPSEASEDVSSPEGTSSSSSSSSSDSSDTESSSSDDSDNISPEYLDSLLRRTKETLEKFSSADSSQSGPKRSPQPENDEKDSGKPLPNLSTHGLLPKPYFNPAMNKLLRNPDDERLKDESEKLSIAKTLPRPPELSKKTGLPLTRAERKAIHESTAGPNWFELPAPSESELPRLAREVEAMRLRNALDPKRFYRKEDTRAGPLPKHFAIGHIIATDSNTVKDLAGAGRDDLPRSSRKRTIVEELLADEEARTYAKKKFEELEEKQNRGKRSNKRKRSWY